MHESIYIAASAGLKQARKMEIIAQNLANVNNTGYKKDALVFKEMMAPFKSDSGFEEGKNTLLTPDKSNKNVSYVGITDYYTDFSTGGIKTTGGSLDLALDGEGFFKVQTPDGPRYTRNGNFRLNTAKQLVNQNGNQVLDRNDTPVVIDAPGEISIDGEGSVSVGTGLANTTITNIKLVNFENKRLLEKMGDGLYRHTGLPEDEMEASDTKTRQGFLESSNVKAVEEMTEMVGTLRIFESYQKIIQSIDSMNDQSVNTIGRVG
ncbi:MAG: flagellar basal-body rod protein FlgF [Nitrospinales bacterium]|jgi:flagellar basal-body rod protein FlgF